ncbi:fumarylacetoacetate hydrolase family protein [Alteromonadaceae bacterium BrNp21-10]|nr:fumarylacetoacetate hydrolase family protein [Alteromonadaceae bacterium BrNp21-10]
MPQAQPTSLTTQYLPQDHAQALLLARVWHQDNSGNAGPSPVLIKNHHVYDLSDVAPTMAQLINDSNLGGVGDVQNLPDLGDLESILVNTNSSERDPAIPYFIAPIDLQAVKACGVTFVCSMLERVIEEKAGGDASKAQAVREKLNASLDIDLSQIVPGSEDAERLKQALVAEGMWSQYLEVGIGPYAEVFTKSQALSSVGLGAEVGINRISSWNNPEPEVVLIVDNQGRIQGASLGNDVNLRDIEGRSALLLGKAKDNNASCSIGPFVRLFNDSFNLDDIRSMRVDLEIDGPDGFRLRNHSDMGQISRDVTDLVKQTINPSHQYPDGLALFTGTLFAPTQDRAEQGSGFTHHIGDVVRVKSAQLGCLQNTVNYSDAIAPWDFGISALMQNLAKRGKL